MKPILNFITRAGLLCCVAVISFAQGASPAQPQSTKGAVIKGKAPVSKEILKVTLPKATQTKLSNGLEVIVLESHKLPTFSMQMVVQAGGLADVPNQIGTAQFAASLLREGTKTRDSKKLAEQIDTLGASLNAAAGLTSTTTTISASGLTDNIDQVLELFADVILNPTFPADEFEKLRARQMSALRAQRSQPNFLADERISKALYGNHPASRASLTAEDLQRLTPEMLQKFHATYFKPNNAFLAITGDVKPQEVVAKLEKAFGSWQKGDVPANPIPQVSDLGAAKIYLIDRPGSVQTNLVLGTLAIDRTNPDYFPLQVMNQVFGGSASARLFLNLREDKGYTYGAYSRVNAPRYRGNFRANTEVRSEVTDGSMHELFYELKRIRDEKVPATELENAKRSIVGSFALQLESPQTLLNNIVTQKLYGLPADYWDTYPQTIAAVTPEDIQRVAQKYLVQDKLQIVAVGDASKIADSLKKYGTVEVYDTDGKPKAAASASSKGTSSGGNAGLAGEWTLMVKTPDGNEIPLQTTIKVDGGNITGNIESPFGPSQIVSGEAKGEDVTFKIKADVQGQTMEMNFTGKQSGKSLKGSISSNAFPPMDVNGTKKD